MKLVCEGCEYYDGNILYCIFTCKDRQRVQDAV